jgi:sulfur carrier protein
VILQINGEARELGEGTTVDIVVRALAGTLAGMAVAVNEDVVPRSAWGTTVLKPGDRVEVLTAAQGG